MDSWMSRENESGVRLDWRILQRVFQTLTTYEIFDIFGVAYEAACMCSCSLWLVEVLCIYRRWREGNSMEMERDNHLLGLEGKIRHIEGLPFLMNS